MSGQINPNISVTKSIIFSCRTSVECSDNIQSLNIFPDRDRFEGYVRRTSLGGGPNRLSDSGLFQIQKAKEKANAPKVRFGDSNAYRMNGRRIHR